MQTSRIVDRPFDPLGQILGSKGVTPKPPFYIEDMSSKNPRFKGHMGPLFSQ